jgi:hypothetical protein
MRLSSGLSLLCFAICISGCSWTPSLDEATGSSEPPPIFVDDVVTRVKCEIYDSAKTLDQPTLAWAADWQVKANLTLQVVDTGGLTPNVSAVKYLPNAYYNARSSTGGILLTTKVHSWRHRNVIRIGDANGSSCFHHCVWGHHQAKRFGGGMPG